MATRELVHRSAESLEGDGTVLVLSAMAGSILRARTLTRITSADAEENLANIDTGDGTVGLAPGATHTGLQSIGTSAGQHLVDTDNVVRMGADAEMEALLSSLLHKVLVGADASGLESLRTQLFVLIGDHVDAEREVIDVRLLTTEVEDANLGIGNTTVEAGLRIRLCQKTSVQDHVAL